MCKQVLARYSKDCKRLLAIGRVFRSFLDDVYHSLLIRGFVTNLSYAIPSLRTRLSGTAEIAHALWRNLHSTLRNRSTWREVTKIVRYWNRRFAWDCVNATGLQSDRSIFEWNIDLTPMNQCVFSPDRTYRYVLRCRCVDGASESAPKPRSARCNPELYRADRSSRPRKRGALHKIAWIGLNPSTADEVTLDQTLAAVCRYSKKWGFSEVVMLNLFAFRATDPRDLKRAMDPIGPENDEYLLVEVRSVDRIIACWGDHGRFLGRDRQVSGLLGVSFECLLRNRTGAPHHPLYLKSRIKPKPFRLDQIRN
jgi:hypothetical protein